MIARELRTRIKALADTIPLDTDENRCACIAGALLGVEQSIQYAIDRSEYAAAKVEAKVLATKQAQLPARKQIEKKSKAKMAHEAEKELATKAFPAPGRVEVEQ